MPQPFWLKFFSAKMADCAICLSSILAGEPTWTWGCGHVTHLQCTADWRASDPGLQLKCAVCRFPFADPWGHTDANFVIQCRRALIRPVIRVATAASSGGQARRPATCPSGIIPMCCPQVAAVDGTDGDGVDFVDINDCRMHWFPQ